MESEKVKEIKELLRCLNGEKACTNCYINDIAQEQETCCINVVADMTLDLINELESENERLEKTVKDMSGIIKVHKYCVGADHCQNSSAREFELKDRIAELKKENTRLLDSVETVQNNRCTTKCELTKKQLKQFAERLMNYSEFLLHADDNGNLLYVDFTVWLDETLKEFMK